MITILKCRIEEIGRKSWLDGSYRITATCLSNDKEANVSAGFLISIICNPRALEENYGIAERLVMVREGDIRHLAIKEAFGRYSLFLSGVLQPQ